MAIYHMSIKIGSRSGGRSACAAAAYRAGDKVHDEEQGRVYDYTAKRGVVHDEIMLPEHAPEAWRDRATLWNAVEERERNANSQLYREFEIALPRELTRGEQRDLVREWVQSELVSRGMCADFAIHDRGDGNPHAHIMATTRPIDARGKWGAKEKKAYVLDENGERVPVIDPKTGKQKIEKKTGRRVWARETVAANDWNDRARAEEWRASWARACNARLPDRARIDHRSHERRGIVDRVPGVHVGYGRNRAERRAMNQTAQKINFEFRRLDATQRSVAEQEKTQNQLDALSARLDGIKRRKNTMTSNDAQKNQLDALTARYDGIMQRRKNALEQARETFKSSPILADVLDAFKTLIRAAAEGDKSAAGFLNDNRARAPWWRERDWQKLTVAERDEILLRRAYRDDDEGEEAPRGFMQLSDEERRRQLSEHWERQQTEERKRQREAKKAEKAEDKAPPKRGGAGRVRTRAPKGGGGR